MIYFETVILAIFALLAIALMIVFVRNFIRDQKIYTEWKKKKEFANLFCECCEIITGEKFKITTKLSSSACYYELEEQEDQ